MNNWTLIGCEKIWGKTKFSRIAALCLVVMLVVGIVPGGMAMRLVFADEYYAGGEGYGYRPTDLNRYDAFLENYYMPIAPATTAVYLQNGINGTGVSNLRLYPASGTFTFGGTIYTSGIRTPDSTWQSRNDGSITYNLTDRGFTRLSGMFGRVAGTGTGALLITADGRYLFSQTLASDTVQVHVNVAIPRGVGQITIRILSNTNNSSFGFGNAYFIADGTNVPAQDRVFIPCDIGEPVVTNLSFFPGNAYFSMGGASYFRGMTTNNSTWATPSDGIFVYNIYGRRFTRLSGEFGRTSGTGAGRLVVQADGRFIFGHVFSPAEGPERLNIPLPAGAREIRIRLQALSPAGTNFGFGNAYFIADGTSPFPPPGNYYLQSDIFEELASGLVFFPVYGSFDMHAATYFTGIRTDNGTWQTPIDGLITYDIAGRGFTRLTGMYGRASGTGTGSIVIYGDDVEPLFTHNFVSGDPIRQINVDIPSGTRRITIRLRVTGTGTNFGFGDAFFTAAPYPPPPSPPPLPSPSPSPPPIIWGDVNRDGQVTAADVGMLRAYLAGFPVDICLVAADVTQDGQVTAADVGLLRAYLAGFPVRLGPER